MSQSNLQSIIEQQQAQIEKLLTRFNELNNDHQSLLELHQSEQQIEKRSSFKFGTFGQAIKQQIKSIKTPRNSTFKSVISNNSSDESEQSFPDTISDGIKQFKDRKVQTNTIANTTKSVSVQTDENAEMSQQLVDEIIELKTKYMQLKELYDRVLSKQSEYCHTLHIREGQIKDIAMERNKIRKEVQNLTNKNESLMQVLELKSKQTLDPHAHANESVILDQEHRTPSAQSVDLGNDEHSSIASQSPKNIKNMTKSLLFSLSPVLLFKSKKKTQSIVDKESVDLANRLMKVIQDKDDVINALRAQLKNTKDVVH